MSWSPWHELRRYPDVWVHRCRLDEGRGWWCPQERVILLDDRLDRRAARSVLAHELGHVALGHFGCEDFGCSQWLARRIEAQADRWAARRLVGLADLAEVLVERPADLEAAARALRVTAEVLATRLAMLDPADRSVVLARVASVEDAA